MKRILIAGLLVLPLVAHPHQQASAWFKFNAGVAANADLGWGGSHNLLWGAVRCSDFPSNVGYWTGNNGGFAPCGGQAPGPFGAHMPRPFGAGGPELGPMPQATAARFVPQYLPANVPLPVSYYPYLGYGQYPVPNSRNQN